VYNIKSWSMTVMMWKVADTPEPVAMVKVRKFSRSMSVYKMDDKRRLSNGKAKDSHSFKSL
jgi:hypothetical protein